VLSMIQRLFNGLRHLLLAGAAAAAQLVDRPVQ